MTQSMAVPNEAVLSAPAAGPTRPRRHLIWRLIDKVSVYLPVLLMGLLAMGTYWLLQLTPEPVIPAEQVPVSHDADLIMKGFSVKTFDGVGRQETEVFGVEARHFPDTKEIEVTDAKIRTFSPTGQLTIASANLITANDAGTVYTLRGDGQVIRQAGKDANGRRTPRMEFYGEFLKVTLKPETVFSNKPVLVIRGKDQMKANSLMFRGDDYRRIRLKGDVKAVIQPAGQHR